MKVIVEVKDGMVQDVFVTDHLGNEVNFILEIIDHDNRDEDSAEFLEDKVLGYQEINNETCMSIFRLV